MKYQTGSPGRMIVARFDDGDDIIASLEDMAKKENLRAAVVYLVGGIKGGRFVVGPKTEQMPPEPQWREITESHETLTLGTLFWQGDTPKFHLHGAFGKGDNVRVGCLREKTSTFLVLEAIIIEIDGIEATRELDPDVGLALLKL